MISLSFWPLNFYLVSFLRAHLSSETFTAPMMPPSAPRMGAQLSAIWRSVLSRAMSAVWLASSCCFRATDLARELSLASDSV